MTLLAALLSGCGSSEDSFRVYLYAPSWSPDGKSIAFVADNDLYVTELGGKTIRRGNLLAENEAAPFELTRSPDGTKIAYDVCEQSEVNPYCWYSRTVVRDLASGRSFVLTRDGAATGSCPVWSPDGKRLALLTSGEGTSTYVSLANSDGRGVERLVRASDSTTSCTAWSPDGRSIAYACCGIGSDIYLVEVERRRTRRLTRDMSAGGVTWSPDGKRIAFLNIADAFSIKPDGTGRALIARNATDLQWSPNGRRIAYLDLSVGEEPYKLFVADQDGSNKHLVSRAVCCPRWSPSGNQLAFVKEDSNGQAAIYVVGADGTRLVKASSSPQANDN